MKKIILSVLTVFLLSFALVGCGTGKAKEEVKIGYKGTLGDDIEYKVVGLESTTKLEGVAPIGNSLYYEPQDSSNVFLDFILDVTNNGKKDFNPFNSLEGKYIIDGAEYTISSQAEVGGEVLNFNVIKPKTSGYVHVYSEINKEAISDNIELQLVYGSDTQSFLLNKENLKPKMNKFNYGDVISDENKNIEISIVKGYTTKKLDTPVQGEYITHSYEVDNVNSTYAILELSILNKMTTDLSIDDTISVSTLVGDGYCYNGFMIGLSDDQTNFELFPQIKPNQNKTIYALIEIPDDMLDEQIIFKLNAFRQANYIDLN